eukprot:3833064-Pleurochrysis_carterae.AAC.2
MPNFRFCRFRQAKMRRYTCRSTRACTPADARHAVASTLASPSPHLGVQQHLGRARKGSAKQQCRVRKGQGFS